MHAWPASLYSIYFHYVSRVNNQPRGHRAILLSPVLLPFFCGYIHYILPSQTGGVGGVLYIEYNPLDALVVLDAKIAILFKQKMQEITRSSSNIRKSSSIKVYRPRFGPPEEEKRRKGIKPRRHRGLLHCEPENPKRLRAIPQWRL